MSPHGLFEEVVAALTPPKTKAGAQPPKATALAAFLAYEDELAKTADTTQNAAPKKPEIALPNPNTVQEEQRSYLQMVKAAVTTLLH